jgi:hypothetical protein
MSQAIANEGTESAQPVARRAARDKHACQRLRLPGLNAKERDLGHELPPEQGYRILERRIRRPFRLVP